MPSNHKVGVDILGFGPIGRELARRIVHRDKEFYVATISDSSGVVHPRDRSEVLKIAEWKEESKTRRLSSLGQVNSARDSLESVESSKGSIVVDVTNSDYGKRSEAIKRVEETFRAGKHFVSANKVAFANYFSSILEQAREKSLLVGYGATILGARHAIRVVQSLEQEEVKSCSAVLNTSTTLILSRMEENPRLTLDEACNEADKNGVLESDWSIDLDGMDAAAKTAILSNVLFPKRPISVNNVPKKGIRDEEAMNLMKSRGHRELVRLVSEIDSEKALVAPRVIPSDSPLAVLGRFNAVSLTTGNYGEISVRSFGGGVSLTASVLLGDMIEVAEKSP